MVPDPISVDSSKFTWINTLVFVINSVVDNKTACQSSAVVTSEVVVLVVVVVVVALESEYEFAEMVITK
jgi:hypothetical protein